MPTPDQARPALLWGATGHAKVLRECLRHGGYEVAAVFDNNPDVTPPFADLPLFHGREGFARWRSSWRGELPGFLAAIGGERGQDRLDIQAWLESEGLVAIRTIHPTAFVAADVRIGTGSQVLAQASVCVEVEIGRACIVNTAASVDHECRLQDGVHVAPGARLAGCVEVGRCATVGAGAVILPRVRIGEGAVVGAGAVVTGDVTPYDVIAGVPARSIGTRRPRA